MTKPFANLSSSSVTFTIINRQMNLDTQLAQLETSQLVHRLTDPSTSSGELAYLFKHALTQEAAFASRLWKTRRTEELE
jgi:hypothetical protein